MTRLEPGKTRFDMKSTAVAEEFMSRRDKRGWCRKMRVDRALAERRAAAVEAARRRARCP